MEFQSLEIPPLLLTQLVYFIKQNIIFFHLYHLSHFSYAIHTLHIITIIIIISSHQGSQFLTVSRASLEKSEQEFKDFPFSFWPPRIQKTLKENESWTEYVFGLSKSD